MDNRVYGYARVSTREQNEDRQIEALKVFGVLEQNIIIDKSIGLFQDFFFHIRQFFAIDVFKFHGKRATFSVLFIGNPVGLSFDRPDTDKFPVCFGE